MLKKKEIAGNIFDKLNSCYVVDRFFQKRERKMLHKPLVIRSRWLLMAALIYLYIPICLFLWTWTRLLVAVPAIAVSLFTVYRLFNRFAAANTERDVQITPGMLLFLIVFLFAVAVICGWGDFMLQSADWYKHNALLQDMTYHSWPVFYQDAVTPSMLTYYIGQYLVPAAVGKLFCSAQVTEIVFMLWGVVGLLLVSLNLFSGLTQDLTPPRQLVILLLLLLFNGCLPLAQQLYRIVAVDGTNYNPFQWQWMFQLFGENPCLLQYRSNFVDLRWVMPQCISIWLVLSVWWKHRDSVEFFLPLMLPCMLNGAISFLGLAVMAVLSVAVTWLIEKTRLSDLARKVFSVDNILSLVFLAVPLLVYFSGNLFSEKPAYAGFSRQYVPLRLYVCFVLGEFGLYALLVWKKHRKNSLFWSAILLLSILPFFKVGYFNDLVMSASIPAMFLMMICILDHLLDNWKSWQSVCLVLLLTIAAIYPLQEMNSVRTNGFGRDLGGSHCVSSLEQYSDLETEEGESWKYNYYTYDLDNSLFLRWFSRDSFGSSTQRP